MKFISDLNRGKLFGHPIHIMLVHFPAALLPTAAVVDFSQLLGITPVSTDLLLLWPGVVIGWLAVCFGLWDLIRLPIGSPEMSHALIHGGINASSLGGFTWALILSLQTPDIYAGSIRVWVEIVCTALLLIGNKFGGDLIFRFGVGKIERK